MAQPHGLIITHSQPIIPDTKSPRMIYIVFQSVIPRTITIIYVLVTTVSTSDTIISRYSRQCQPFLNHGFLVSSQTQYIDCLQPCLSQLCLVFLSSLFLPEATTRQSQMMLTWLISLLEVFMKYSVMDGPKPV